MHRLGVLGQLEIDGAAAEVGPRDRVVVSALALHPGERVGAEVLAEALWGDQPPASAPKVIQGCVSRLRKALGSDAIETVAGGYRVRPDQLVIDSQRFEDLVERAREHQAVRAPERAIPLLTDALALWRGSAFGELEEWMPGRLEAVRLGQQRLAAEEDLLEARLDAGDHAGVATDGTVLTGQQPFRERRWVLLALAQYRSGRQADALASIRSARRALGQELGLDLGSELVVLESRILAQDPGLAADHAARLADQTCPWKGLAAYGDRDADSFFGRDADIAACLVRLQASPLLVVTGPSGSGKSSLVQAGLVPALRAGGAEVEVFAPGADGALAMAAARGRHVGVPLLVIDQFEEVFTLSSADSARTWLRELAHYLHRGSPVVLVVRGDHLAALGADEELARLVERGLHLVAPLTGDSLREAIEGPAKVAGLRLEPGLVDLLVRDADGQPGALPLMSHALSETWRRRESGLLTVDGYHAAGGIRDAVAASAERLYDGLGPTERIELRRLMLRLVSLSDTGEPFRTPLPASVVVALDPDRRRLLDLLVRVRLVTSRDGGYDLAHEALVSAWVRLREWLEEDRAGQQIRRHLTMAAAGWEALERPAGELYRGARLAAAQEWLERGHEPLADTERDFIEASRVVADEQVRRLADDARRQRRQNRRLRVLVAAAAALLVVAAAAGGVARDRGRDAERGLEAATAAAATARHESLVARSLAQRSTNRGAAAVLAALAWREQPDALAESSLLGSLTSAPGFLGYRFLALGRFAVGASMPGDDGVLVSVGSGLTRMDPRTGDTSWTVRGPVAASETPSMVRVSADGTRAAQLLEQGLACPPSCPVLVVHDLVARTYVQGPIDVPFAATDVAISRDGGLVTAVGGDSARTGWDVATWDASSGRRIARGRLAGTAVAYGAGDRVYLGSDTGPIRELSARTLQVRRTFPARRSTANRGMVVVGQQLVAAGERGQVAHDLAGGAMIWEERTRRGAPPQGCVTMAVSAELGRVYCGSRTGLVDERDLATGRPTGRVLDAQLGDVRDMAVVDRGRLLIQFGDDQALFATWRLDGPGVGGRLLARDAASAGGYDPTGTHVLISRQDRSEVVDTSGRSVLVLPASGRAVWLSATTIGIIRDRPALRPVLVDVPSGRSSSVSLGGVVALYPEAGGTHAWAVTRQGESARLRRISLTSGQAESQQIGPLPADEVHVVADAGRVVATYRNTRLRGYAGVWATSEYDSGTGEQLGKGLDGFSHLATSQDGSIVAGNGGGVVAEFIAVYGMEGVPFPRAGAAVSSVQISADSQRVAVTSKDQTVQIYDRSSRARLGDPIRTHAPEGIVEGWLRPDGRELLTNTADGVVAWDLAPEAMVRAVCGLAGRNPTRPEWASFMGEDTEYRLVCPSYPGPDDQVPTPET